jgi:hypothetical protein
MHAHDLELVRAPASTPIAQGTARVGAIAGDDIHLERDGRPLVARRATSCLVEPVVGDRVWFMTEDHGCFVLAILEREAGAPARLRVDGDAELHASGELRLRGASVGVETEELELRSGRARVVVGEVNMVLRKLLSHVTSSTLIAKVVEIFSERSTSRSKTSYRAVEHTDVVAAGTIDYRADHAAHIGARHALVKGGELVKVDGGQIHLG